MHYLAIALSLFLTVSFVQTEQEKRAAFVKAIAGKIVQLKARYPHLKNFYPQFAIIGSGINHMNNYVMVPNANPGAQAQGQQQAKSENPRRRQLFTVNEVPKFDEHDGVSININFIAKSEAHKLAREIQAFVETADLLVEVDIEGADTEAIRRLREDIQEIVKETVK